MRPALRYHGGKWLLAPWIISHFPPHKIYTESFGGAASVLLRKSRSYAEIYNDLDDEIVNVFSVLRNNGQSLKTLLSLTPFAREEFVKAYIPSKIPLERARQTVIKSYMGFGSDSIRHKSGFRANSNRSGTTPAHDWANYSKSIDDLIARLQGVVIEHRDALEVMKCHDSVDTLHYVDPPYVHSTRTAANHKAYRFEMTDYDHTLLSEFLTTLKGFVVVSGYDSPLYRKLYRGWKRAEKATFADGAKKRTEVLWMKNKIPLQ